MNIVQICRHRIKPYLWQIHISTNKFIETQHSFNFVLQTSNFAIQGHDVQNIIEIVRFQNQYFKQEDLHIQNHNAKINIEL
jgi:hypothetical protein